MYNRHRFPPEIIQYAVLLYYLFNLSHRDIEDNVSERGIILSRESVRLWCNKFRLHFTRRLKHKHRGTVIRFSLTKCSLKLMENSSTNGVLSIRMVTSLILISNLTVMGPQRSGSSDRCWARIVVSQDVLLRINREVMVLWLIGNWFRTQFTKHPSMQIIEQNCHNWT